MTEEEAESKASSNNTMVPYNINNPAVTSNNTMAPHIDTATTTTTITIITNSNSTPPLHQWTQSSSWSVALCLLLIIIMETPRSVLIYCCSINSFTTHSTELRRSNKMVSHYERKYQHQSKWQQAFLSSQEATESAKFFWCGQVTNARKGRGSLEQDAQGEGYLPYQCEYRRRHTHIKTCTSQ